MRRLRSLGILLLAVACAPVHAVIGDPGTDPVHAQASRFEGTWFIEETVAHATYFASKWRFRADGSLELIEDYSMGGDPGYPSVSWIGNAYVVCFFAQTWRSDDDRTLRIDTECNDGTDRVLDVIFEADASRDVTGIEPTGLAVDGDGTMWSAPVWGWRFTRCEGDHSNCAPWSP